MKIIKKILPVGIIAIAATTFVACSDIKSNNNNSEQVVDIKAQAEEYKELVSLANYKGIDVKKVEEYTVSDEEIENELSFLKDTYKKTESVDVTESGCNIKMDFTGYIDGEEFEGGSAKDYDYVVGSNLFIDGFDEQLIGKKKDEKFNVNVTFPEDYLDESLLEDGDVNLNGKEAVFKVTITDISKDIDEELNDTWVNEHGEELKELGLEASSLEELKSAIKKSIEDSYKLSNTREIGTEALDKVIENSTIISYTSEKDAIMAETRTGLEQEFEQYKDNFNVDTVEEYFNASYGDEQTMEEYIQNYAESYLDSKMITYLIADEQNLTIDSVDVNNVGQEIATYYGLNNYEELINTYGDKVRADMEYQALYDKVIEYLASVSNPVLEENK